MFAAPPSEEDLLAARRVCNGTDPRDAIPHAEAVAEPQDSLTASLLEALLVEAEAVGALVAHPCGAVLTRIYIADHAYLIIAVRGRFILARIY